MFEEAYKHDPIEPRSEKTQIIQPEIMNALFWMCVIFGLIYMSSTDYLHYVGVWGAVFYTIEGVGTGIGLAFVILLLLTFAKAFSDWEFFAEHKTLKWVVITVFAGIVLYLSPLNFGSMPKRCPVCGQETEYAYIVYDGQRYCLRDGSRALYEDGEYDFYE